jgi:hypothetical protein
LAYLNPILIGKKGLLQRAVDSYRNRFPSATTSRRVKRAANSGIIAKKPRSKAKKQQEQPLKHGNEKSHLSTIPLFTDNKDQSLNYNSNDLNCPVTPQEFEKQRLEFEKQLGLEHISAYNLPLQLQHESLEAKEIEGEDVEVEKDMPNQLQNSQNEANQTEEYELQELNSNSPIKLQSGLTNEIGTAYIAQSEDTTEKINRKTMIINTVKNARPFQLEIFCDIENVPNDVQKINKSHIPFSNANNLRKLKCNEMALKLSYLNPHKLADPWILQRAVDVYLVKNESCSYWPPRRKILLGNRKGADSGRLFGSSIVGGVDVGELDISLHGISELF